MLLALLCVGGIGLYLWQVSAGGTVARISVNGEVYEEINLAAVKEEYELVIETKFGKNTVLVAPGKISVIEANCPDHVCVARGELSHGGVPIVCMPNRLVIEMLGGEHDA